MIYDFTVEMTSKSGKKSKQFYLTADSTKQLYRLAWDMYRLKPSDIVINNTICEDDIPVNISNNPPEPTYSDETLQIATQLLNHTVYGRPQTFFDEKSVSGYNVSEISLDVEAIASIIQQGFNPKIYYLQTGSKKSKRYFAVYRDR